MGLRISFFARVRDLKLKPPLPFAAEIEVPSLFDDRFRREAEVKISQFKRFQGPLYAQKRTLG